MTNYLVGADWKIPNWLIWLIKSTFLGKSEATISLGIKSVLFSWTWTPIPVIFLFNTVTTQQILDKACHAPLGMQVSGVLASLLLCGDTWVACGGVCICRVKSCHAQHAYFTRLFNCLSHFLSPDSYFLGTISLLPESSCYPIITG